MSRTMVGIALMVVLVAGCSAAENVSTGSMSEGTNALQSAEDLGAADSACTKGDLTGETLADRFMSTQSTWVSYDFVEADREAGTVDIEVTAILTTSESADRPQLAPGRMTVHVSAAVVEAVMAESSAGGEFVGALRHHDKRDPVLFSEGNASLRQDGSVIFLGACAYASRTKPFADFAASMSRSASAPQLLKEILSSPDPAAGSPAGQFKDFLGGGARSGGEVPWDQIPVGQRPLDPELTPPEELARYRQVSVLVSVPADWLGMDPPRDLCIKVPVGWSGNCQRLSVSRRTPFRMTLFAAPGENAEIVLRAAATPTSIETVLGTLLAEEVSNVDELSITLSGPVASPSLELASN